MDFKNFAYSTVKTAPSPAASGTSVVVQTGHGSRFPSTFPFLATIWPVSVLPTSSNAEIVKVTGISTDTLTIVRQQEGTSARTVTVGDQIAQNITAATMGYKQFVVKTANYTATVSDHVIICNSATAFTITLPAAGGTGKAFYIKNVNTGAVTIDGDSSDTIDGQTTQVLSQWDGAFIIDYASNKWAII